MHGAEGVVPTAGTDHVSVNVPLIETESRQLSQRAG
jgi:hypothetical protein